VRGDEERLSIAQKPGIRAWYFRSESNPEVSKTGLGAR